MSYYGEPVFNQDGDLASVGDRKVSDLTEKQRAYIAGMQYIYDQVENEEADYDSNDTILDRIVTECAIDALEEFKKRILSDMIEAVVSFADVNAEREL